MKASIDLPEMPDTPAALLYRRHAAPLLVYLRVRVATPEDAEDLLTEVFLAAFEHSALLAFPEAEQRAWLQRVARNKVADYYRRTVRRTTVTVDQVAEVLQEDEERSPEWEAVRQEERQHLRAAIKRLPAMQQEVLRLRFRDGLHAAQIAMLVGKRESAIQKLLYRAIVRLRTLYAETTKGAVSHETR